MPERTKLVKILDMTDEPLCVSCLTRKIMDGIRSEQLVGHPEPEGVKLTTQQRRMLVQTERFKATYLNEEPSYPTNFAEYDSAARTIFGIPIWEVEK